VCDDLHPHQPAVFGPLDPCDALRLLAGQLGDLPQPYLRRLGRGQPAVRAAPAGPRTGAAVLVVFISAAARPGPGHRFLPVAGPAARPRPGTGVLVDVTVGVAAAAGPRPGPGLLIVTVTAVAGPRPGV